MKTNRLITVLAVVTLMLPACSPGAELAEKILESEEGVGDIEIDEDNGEIRIEGEGEDGDSFTIGGGEIPEDFPIDVPDGGEVQSVVNSDREDVVAIRYDGGFDALKSFYEDWSSANGEVLNKSETSNPPSVSWVVEDDDTTYSISVFDADPFVQVTLIAQGGN